MAGVVACGSGERADSAPPAAAAPDTVATLAPGLLPGTPEGGLADWIAEVESELVDVPARAAAGEAGAGQRVVELYIGRQEFIERYYGPGGLLEPGGVLAEAVRVAELRFHELMTLTGGAEAPDSAAVAGAAGALLAQYDVVLEEARHDGVPLDPRAAGLEPPDEAKAAADKDATAGDATAVAVRALIAEVEAVERAYHAGDRKAALAGLQRAYLEHVEPLEPLLPTARVMDIERSIHLRLRPALASRAPDVTVREQFDELYRSLGQVEASVRGGTPFWLGATHGFAIIVREGLEAVLLIGAILAYLGRIPEGERHRRRVYWGVGGGIVASLLTWFVAQALIPVSAGNRELIEGVTALLAVAVLL
ncbi:MAG: FTR1 family protein, partial [Gemmatimonadota bacterium]